MEQELPVDGLQQEIEEFFVEKLLSTHDAHATAAIYATTVAYKDAFASSAAFAFVSSAINFENGVFELTSLHDQIVKRVYKATALFSVDMFAAETLLRRRITCGDVYDIWRQTHDPVFLPPVTTKKEGDRSPPL